MNIIRDMRVNVALRCAVVLFVLTALLPASPASAAGGDELMSAANALFGPLPSSMASPDNPITPEKVRLGNALFWEPRISIDGTISCATCHPISLYGADGLAKAEGNRCKENPRNAPTVFNAADQIAQHWIGNRKSVEDQAKQALVGPPSFGMPSYESVEKVLRKIPGYGEMFQKAFPGEKDPVTADNFAKAIGAFERTLVTPSPFDDFMKGNDNALSARQKKGLAAFIAAGCVACHAGPYMGGKMFEKFGKLHPYWNYTKSAKIDKGRFAATKDPADTYVFKVPVLRNVAETPPYFHDGSVAKLDRAVSIMAKVQLNKDLSPEQAKDIAAFLKSLTGKIPDGAITLPVLPSAE